MWRFVEHHVMRPALWTWVQLDADGACLRRSPTTFASLRGARYNARKSGFDPRLERFEIVELHVRHEARPRNGLLPLTGLRSEARGGSA